MLNIELSSFAKNLEGLKAVIENGADSVFIGGDSFGMDTTSKNFSKEELKEAIDFVHDKNKKIYVTISVLPHNNDFIKLEEYLIQLDKLGVDALIICDPGALEIVKKVIPNMKIHMGTQANIYNYETANFWHNEGINRVVIAKELGLKDIHDIRRNTSLDLEIEAFVHGGMCMSYSGRRLLSSYMATKENKEYNEEINYNLVEEKRPDQFCPIYEDEGGTFFYASKDLCMIEYIPDLIKSGVTTLSIEGNIKSNEYMKNVVQIYREAIDEFLSNPEAYEFKKQWIEQLLNIDKRKLTTGFYLDENKDYEI